MGFFLSTHTQTKTAGYSRFAEPGEVRCLAFFKEGFHGTPRFSSTLAVSVLLKVRLVVKIAHRTRRLGSTGDQ